MVDPRETKQLPFMTQYIFCDKPLEFINFITKVFDAEEQRERATHENIIANALFDVAGSLFEISQARDQFNQITHSFHLYSRDCENIILKAEKEGCEIKYKFKKMEEYGDEESWIIDPFGNNWFLATPLD